jgi:hypothetical protein
MRYGRFSVDPSRAPSPTPSPPPGNKLDRRQTERLRKRDNLLTGERGGGSGGAKSYDGESARPSINHSIFSGGHSKPTGVKKTNFGF